MSELKAFETGLGKKVYLKSEADKVINELKAQKAQTEDDCAYWKSKVQRERHHKFKRCLDEAKICQLRLERYEQYVTKYKDCNGPSIQRWRFLKDHYEKWYMRWFKIAEQFNTNSTATKENSDG